MQLVSRACSHQRLSRKNVQNPCPVFGGCTNYNKASMLPHSLQSIKGAAHDRAVVGGSHIMLKLRMAAPKVQFREV